MPGNLADPREPVAEAQIVRQQRIQEDMTPEDLAVTKAAAV